MALRSMPKTKQRTELNNKEAEEMEYRVSARDGKRKSTFLECPIQPFLSFALALAFFLSLSLSMSCQCSMWLFYVDLQEQQQRTEEKNSTRNLSRV